MPAAGPVSAVNVDLSTVSAATDAIFAVGDPPSHYVTFDFQTGRDAELSRRVLVYNVLLHQRFGRPVHSVVVLLRRSANDIGLDGTVRYEVVPGLGGMDFRFEIVRVWEKPVAELLRGAVGTLPLATLGALPAGMTPEVALPAVVRQLEGRLAQETAPPVYSKLMTTAFVLTGMRLSAEQAADIFQGVQIVEESTTYQWIMQKGEVRHARKTLFVQGRAKFGEPDTASQLRLLGLDDLEVLDRLIERSVHVNSWQELFEGG